MSIKPHLLFLLMGGLLGCENAANKTTPDSSPAVSASAASANAKTPPGPLPATSRIDLMDSLALCYQLVKEKTLPAFVKGQPVTFKVLADTVINDERGLIVGNRLSVGTTFLQWLDNATLTRAVITDSRLVFQQGIRIGMSKQAFSALLGIKPFAADTVSLSSGFLDNHCDFYFQQGALRQIVLENLPD